MRGRPPLGNAARAFQQLQRPGVGIHGRRAIQISATPTSESPILNGDPLSRSIDVDSAGILPVTASYGLPTNMFTLDARFEVLGAPYSLLSVSLSASQKLYTRRGTLVAVSGKSEHVCILQYL